MEIFQNTVCTHPRADMLSIPPSWLGYARRSAPSPLSRQAQHLNSVRKAG
jgi:hypothetical protein